MRRSRAPDRTRQGNRGPGGRGGTRLLVLLVVALLPLTALAVYASYEQLLVRRARVHGEALSLSQVAAKSAQDFADQTQAMLSALTREPAIAHQDADAARKLLAAQLAEHPGLADIVAADAGGTVYADPVAGPHSIAAERCFQEAMRTGKMSVQAVVTGEAGALGVDLLLCLPVTGAAGRPAGAVQAAVRPAHLREFVSPVSLPPGAVLALIDSSGTIIVHSADPQRWLGRALSPLARAHLVGPVGATWEGTVFGQPSVAGSATVTGTPWQAVVALAAPRALASWRTSLWQTTAFLLGALALALFLNVQAGHLGGQGWRHSSFLGSLLDSTPMGVAVIEGAENRLSLANPAYRDLAGQAGGPVTGRTVRQVLPEPTAHAVEEGIGAARRVGQRVTAHELPVTAPQTGEVHYWDVDYVPVPPPDGRAGAVLMLATPVTEKVRARRNLQTILDQLPDGVLAVDATGRVTLTNDTFRYWLGRDVVGVPLGELLRQHPLETAAARPFAPGETPLERALRRESVSGVEVVVPLPDGARVFLLESAAPLVGDGGRAGGAVVSATDITSQKEVQAERARLLAQVESARESLQTILSRLPDGVMVVDTSQRITASNEALRRYLGRDVVGMRMPDMRRVYHYSKANGEPFAPGETPLDHALRGESVTGVEVRAILAGERRLDMLESTAPLYAPHAGQAQEGRILGAVVALTDITPLKQAQAERERLLAEVQRARENLRTIMDQLPDGVLVVNRQQRLSLSNSAARRYVGHEVTGMRLQDLWQEMHFTAPGGQPFPGDQAPVERAFRGEVVTGVEGIAQLPDGRRIDLLDSVAPLYGPDGQVREVAIALTDVTPLKELDRAKDQFISVAAHELRAPLTSLKGHAQILQRRAARAQWRPEEQRSLYTINEQVDRLNHLIGRLLDVSRIRLGRLQLHKEPTDIVALARRVSDDMQVTTEAHRISVQAEVPELVGLWDPEAVRQVLTNLIGNAIKYAPGGPIDVRVRREADWAFVSVSDCGPGIAPERQKLLFEAFAAGAAREYRHPGGLGLGLYISRGIVEAHGGRIWVESRVGVGSTFTFTLPLHA